MRKFFINHKHEPLSFMFEFDSIVNQIRGLKIEGTLNDVQYKFLMENFPVRVEKLEYWKKLKQFKVIEEKVEITFEAFYEKYGNKVGKKSAEKAWNRLSKANRLLAYEYIPKYKYKLVGSTAMKYPASYLNQEPWND